MPNRPSTSPANNANTQHRTPGARDRTAPAVPLPPALAPIQYSVVRYPERASEIHALRRVAYTAAQTYGPSTTEGEETDLNDPRDQRASIVIAESAGQIVGALRLTPPLPGPVLHHNCQLEGPTHGLPPRSEFMEASWACVHPDHQGKGLFWQLAARMLLIAKQFGRPYLVGATTAGLWRSWRRCGFRKIGATYRGEHSGVKHWVMMLELEETLAGRNIAPEFARVLLPLLAAPNPLSGAAAPGG